MLGDGDTREPASLSAHAAGVEPQCSPAANGLNAISHAAMDSMLPSFPSLQGSAKMPGTNGLRSRTRHMFARGFRNHGYIPLTTYLRNFKVGDYVDIKVNGAIHKVGGGCRHRLLCDANWGRLVHACLAVQPRAPCRACPTSGTRARLALCGT